MHFRVEADGHLMFSFLNEMDYPGICQWSPEVLTDFAIKFRLEDQTGDTAGYLWGTWRADMERTIEFHACVAPEYRTTWLSAAPLDVVFSFARTLGADRLMAIGLDDRRQRAINAVLIRRFGFQLGSEGRPFKHLTEYDRYGFQQPKASKNSGPAPASRPASAGREPG